MKDESTESADERPEDRDEEPKQRKSSRRDALRKLGTMSFLTAAWIKFGPAPRAQETPPDDLCCEPVGGIPDFADVTPLPEPNPGPDCAPESPVTVVPDVDCGLPNAGGNPVNIEDLDCTPAAESPSDADCGKLSVGGNRYADSDCTATGADNLCSQKLPPQQGYPIFAGDSDCTTPNGSDQDCSLRSSPTTFHKDNECDTYDGDCGLPSPGGGVHQDSDCVSPGEHTQDSDCNKLIPEPNYLGLSYKDNECWSVIEGWVDNDDGTGD